MSNQHHNPSLRRAILAGVTIADYPQVSGELLNYDADMQAYGEVALPSSNWYDAGGAFFKAIGAYASTKVQQGSQERMQQAALDAQTASAQMQAQAQMEAARVQADFQAGSSGIGTGGKIALWALVLGGLGGLGYYTYKRTD